MKPYLISLAVGLLIGVIYALLNVRSPAPPVIALVGLLGILVDEQVPPLIKRVMAGHRMDLAAVRENSAHHVFGPLPQRSPAPPVITAAQAPREEPAA
jgi:XapX domain-containing protein